MDYCRSLRAQQNKKGDEKKVETLVLDTIKKLVEDGIPEMDIESTLTTLEFSHREIKRGHGPFAISLMARPIYGGFMVMESEIRFVFALTLSKSGIRLRLTRRLRR